MRALTPFEEARLDALIRELVDIAAQFRAILPARPAPVDGEQDQADPQAGG